MDQKRKTKIKTTVQTICQVDAVQVFEDALEKYGHKKLFLQIACHHIMDNFVPSDRSKKQQQESFDLGVILLYIEKNWDNVLVEAKKDYQLKINMTEKKMRNETLT
jgi:hypothetical protein